MSVRGILTAWMSLIVLQVVVSARGSEAAGGILGALGSVIDTALDPTKPGFKNRSAGVFKKEPLPTPGTGKGGSLGGSVGPSQPAGGGITPRPV